MKIKIFQVDAFSSMVFKGNPAAVCPLDEWISDELMQNIAAENNLSETAFFNINESPKLIRWFTPTVEVDLCGHATLASAKVLFDFYLNSSLTEIIFASKSGPLKAMKQDDLIVLDFPIDMPSAIEIDNLIEEGVGARPIELYKGRDDYLAIFEDIACIQNPALDFTKIAELNARGLIISAKGKDVDFVSRCFYPQTGVNEDPVTGSAHTLLAPYWASQLKKSELSAAQLSARGGNISCKVADNRVLLGGNTAIYSEGSISV